MTINLAAGTTNTVTVPANGDQVGIYAENGSLELTGDGDLTVTQNSGYSAVAGNGLHINMNGNLTVNSDGDNLGIGSDGDVIISGSGDVIVTSSGSNAVGLTMSYGTTLQLNGTGSSLTFEAGGGCSAIYNYKDHACPVTINSNYKITAGDPREFSVKYEYVANPVLRVGGMSYSNADLATDKTGEGWSWDAADAILTLSDYDDGYIWAKNDLKINVAGTDNTVTASADVNKVGIHAENGSLELTGDGHLTVIQNGHYSAVAGDELRIDMKGNLTVDSNGSGFGIGSNGDVIISGSGNVIVTSSGDNAVGLTMSNGTTLQLNGTGYPLTFTAGEGYSAVYNYYDNTSLAVGGTSINDGYYNKVIGGPDKQSVTYTRKTRKPAGGGGGAEEASYVTYTLTFNTDGGSAIDSVTKTYGTTVNLESYTSTKEGYDFAGWYSDENLTSEVTSITLTKNTSVYAKWTEDSEEEVTPPVTEDADTSVTDLPDTDMPFTDVNSND